MTINDNSTKSINAAIIDLQNQMKQLQYKIDILSKNQLKEDDIEFPGKVEYADEAGKAKEADHAKTADTAKYSSETENAAHAGYADNATKATQDASGNVITDTYLPLSGGAMTGDIQYKGSKSTDKMIKFIDNTGDVWGNGISIGGGGLTIIGGGESSDIIAAQQIINDEKMIIANDGAIDFYTNCQDGFASAKHITMNADGNITTPLGTVALKGDIGEYLYYEDYRFDNPSWETLGNVYYASMLKTWTGDIRNKIISAQVVYWSGFYPWAILDHTSPGSTKTTLALFSANNVQGWCIVRVWYKR